MYVYMYGYVYICAYVYVSMYVTVDSCIYLTSKYKRDATQGHFYAELNMCKFRFFLLPYSLSYQE